MVDGYSLGQGHSGLGVVNVGQNSHEYTESLQSQLRIESERSTPIMVNSIPPPHQRETLTVELYVRSLSPPGLRARQSRIINRLERLTAIGTIGDYSVIVWGDQLAEPDIERTETAKRIYERIESFRYWADTHDATLAPFFEPDHVHSPIEEEEYTQIDFPAMTLAEYGANGLRFVAPCTEGETVHSVADRLDALEAESPLRRGADPDRSLPRER